MNDFSFTGSTLTLTLTLRKNEVIILTIFVTSRNSLYGESYESGLRRFDLMRPNLFIGAEFISEFKIVLYECELLLLNYL